MSAAKKTVRKAAKAKKPVVARKATTKPAKPAAKAKKVVTVAKKPVAKAKKAPAKKPATRKASK